MHVSNIIRSISNLIVLSLNIIFIIIVAICGYFLLDNQNVFSKSDSERFIEYSPLDKNNKKLSYEDLKKINSDVIGWIKIDGTNIDYPIVQSIENKKYLYTDALNNYSSSGSIFVDYKSKPAFDSFITIVYGHHMSNGQMFGELDKYKDKSYFMNHRTGRLYIRNNERIIEFFSFLDNIDGYDTNFYNPTINNDLNKKSYLNSILKNSSIKTNDRISVDDKLVLLSTCNRNITNGRMILVGRITEKIIRQNRIKGGGCREENYIYALWIIIALLCIILIILLIVLSKRNKRK